MFWVEGFRLGFLVCALGRQARGWGMPALGGGVGNHKWPLIIPNGLPSKAVTMSMCLSPPQRAQEWNVSRKELEELVALGVVSGEEAEEVVAVEFNPVRAPPNIVMKVLYY